jgi:DNA-binding Lrp family transcriptional regulator
MGRGRITAPQIDIETVQQHFALRQEGSLVRRHCHIDALNGEPATFIGPSGQRMARFSVQGKVRRVVASRIAWALHYREWPTGPVKPKNGDTGDLRAENLVQTRHGAHRPNAAAGRASSLDRRAETNGALLQAFVERPNPTLAELSQAVGLSEGRVSTRLTKLERQGLTEGPQCCPNRSWVLTAQGRELALSANPVVLDDLDRQVLAALALTSMGTVKLARRVEVCPMTIRRRVRLLAQQGLVFADPRKFFSITPAGLAALPDAPKRWVDQDRLRASKDVQARSPTDDRNMAPLAANARMARGRPRGGKQALLRAMAV